MKNDFKILRAEKMGFCFGVKEAIKTVEEAMLENQGKIYILGMLVHNQQVIEGILKKGVIIIDEKDILEDKIKLNEEDSVIIRAHGTIKKIMDILESKKVKMYDAACIFVKKSRKILSDKEKENYKIIFIGDRFHPEVIGIISYGKNIKVVSDLEELIDYTSNTKEEKYFVLAQTTLNKNKYEKIKKFVKENLKNSEIYDTICGATYERQKAVEKLSNKVDIMLIIGGKNSSNTKKLYNISKEINNETYHIETDIELKKEWFCNKNVIGIAAGASTPEESIIQIEKKIKEELW